MSQGSPHGSKPVLFFRGMSSLRILAIIGNHQWGLLHEGNFTRISILVMGWKITHFKLQLYLPGASEFNSLWPSDDIWQHRSGLTLAQWLVTCHDGIKPLPGTMLTNHQWGLVEFTCGLFHWNCSRYVSLIWAWKLLPVIQDYSRIS